MRCRRHFFIRAGVKGGYSGSARSKDEDKNSSQLDIIIYDTQNYPVYQRFGDTAVVLPEGVIGIISVKKTLSTGDLEHEIEMLRNAAKLCAFQNRRGPFLGLVGMDDNVSRDAAKAFDKAVDAIEKVVTLEKPACYDDMPCFVGNFQKWTIHKRHRDQKECAEFQLFVHKEGEEHLGLQYLLKGILDVYYCGDRGHGKQPGYISFPAGRNYDKMRRIQYVRTGSCR